MAVKTIIVIDGDQSSLASLQVAPSHDRLEIVLSTDGQARSEKFQDEKPDLVPSGLLQQAGINP